MKSFTAVFSAESLEVLPFRLSLIDPDTSSVSTISNGLSETVFLLDIEESADNATRKSDPSFDTVIFFPPFSISRFSVVTVLSDQILPVFSIK